MCHWKDQLKSLVRNDQEAFEAIVRGAMHLAWQQGVEAAAVEIGHHWPDIETYEIMDVLKLELKSPYGDIK